MKPRYCQVIHNPPQSYGDCVRACLATLTDDDGIPHVFDERPPEESWKQIRAYLATKGKKLLVFTLESLEDMAETNPDIPYMLLGKQVFGGLHAVVGMNGKILHDPAAVKRDITVHPELNAFVLFVVI